MIELQYGLGVVLAMAVVTFGLRALPFLAARFLQHHPRVLQLGRFLPLAIMALLLIHALVGGARSHPGAPWPELLAAGVAVGLQVWPRHVLLSVGVATALYVALRNGML
ncbi:MAG: hypothetical protein Fur007_00650 [Rhodoferax sp.]